MPKKKQLLASYDVYEELQELNEVQQVLIAKAKEAARRAYAPYSEFQVGAAALLSSGEIVLGSNQENAAYPVTICAERVAIFSAATQFPEEKIEKIAITVITKGAMLKQPVPPCGSCRQVIYETELRHKQAIELLLAAEDGPIYVISSVKDLLPLLFDASFL